MGKICSFTGHRVQKLTWLSDFNSPPSQVLRDLIKSKILQKINDGYDYFISGMALGVDMMCADIVLELKNDYNSIKLECAIPCENQTQFWPEEQRQKYFEILNRADYINILNKHYSRNCNHIRNQYMVSKSNCLVAIWNGSNGGTKNTIILANKYNIPVEIINPDECLF